MTDLPTIIADVYRACGWTAPHGDCQVWRDEPDGRESLFVDTIGLDVFVRDIVPTLNERGLEPTFMQVGDRWEAELWPRRVHPVGESRVISFGATPVEACFRAAWEALIPGENP